MPMKRDIRTIVKVYQGAELPWSGSFINGISLSSIIILVFLRLFTESAPWADSVIESQCPSVAMYVCDNSKPPLPEVVETSGQRAYR